MKGHVDTNSINEKGIGNFGREKLYRSKDQDIDMRIIL
jgi:hypothetical protein